MQMFRQANCRTYTPCSEDCGEADIPKDIIIEPFNNAEQNSFLKILIRYGEMMGWGEGPIVLR